MSDMSDNTITGVALFVVFVLGLAALGWAAYFTERRFAQRMDEAHVRERETWKLQLEAVARSLHYGSPTRPEAVVIEPEPDVEERAQRAFGQEAIENGKARLREEYEKIGVFNLDDDALRDEAISMLFGASPSPSIPLLRDS